MRAHTATSIIMNINSHPPKQNSKNNLINVSYWISSWREWGLMYILKHDIDLHMQSEFRVWKVLFSHRI